MASAQGDEIALRTLVPLAIACAVAGLGFVYGVLNLYGTAGTTDAPSAPSASTEEEAPSLAPAPREVSPRAQAPEPSSAAPTLGSPADAEPPEAAALHDAGPASAPAQASAIRPEAAPEPQRASAKAPAQRAVAPAHAEAEADRVQGGALRIEPGLIAYLRCDGLAAKGGPFPCPRDRSLERRLREIIDSLPRCARTSSIVRGAFELRAELRRAGTIVEHSVRGPDPEAERAVRACVSAQLERVQATLRPDRMIVSLRFSAR